ncbi:rod shape-determining protein [Candidatus Blochmanniella pennsylvanica str. BPEN]|uniref:Peptidoglycan glycosyltransferase MrdB n=1 Tax=Blochmanniella pennsylvanica (strain BPEN) TaxID=291272 RepID=Q492Z8_BLOPB|nr:rod shape-determining protein RodA [Candidatus Blochmannia pennsylvanicus]AAZ40946.1 rod shape-determining protein [Candidatus Blochmannia pennsylvanicus str. BPEN]UOY04169.1 rod shape-determining protein RodA [Candidatus Blochmannia pennsylvanicus]
MSQIIRKNSLWNRYHIDLTLFLLIICLLLYGIFIMWSACGQNFEMMRLKVFQIIGGLLLMFFLAQVPPRTYEFWTPYIYFLCLILLISVNMIGQISKGAQRWLDFGIIRFQPSEIVKISVLLMVARYIDREQHPPSLKNVGIVLLLIMIPTIFMLLQPDLGTAILTVSSGFFALFLSGISWKLIVFTLLLMVLFAPIFWFFCMHDYQRSRIEILLHPEIDPQGAGYHIIQSKIAIGSGGFTGKGWLHGTQSQLEFLPERHTDFIFSVIGEELGFFGILILLSLYLGIILRGLFIAINTQHMFGRLIIGSFMLVLFMYIFVNVGMVSGLLPIVGIPLPLISYGGSSLLVLMAGFGIVMSINGHRKMISKIL